MTKRVDRPHKKRPKRVYTSVEELLARTVEDGECRIWQGFMQNGRVPMVDHGGKQTSVRKLMAGLSGRPTPSGGYWVARCAVLGCVAPEHVVREGKKEHFRRMTKLLFANAPVVAVRNAKIGRARRKLTQEQAYELMHSDESHEAAARRLGVSATTVQRYRTGQMGATLDRNPWLQLLRLAGVDQKGEVK